MPELFTRFAVALLLGAFIGLERERDGAHVLGIRTFCLIALLGALCAMLAATAQLSWLMPLSLLALAILLAANRFGRAPDEPRAGITTEIAALLSFGLGALTYYGPMELAVALGVVVAALLHFKPQLHHLAERVGDKDLYAMLQVAIVAFVVLPVLPNRTLGPLDVLNPHDIWLMVVFISGISLIAYVALKLVGARYGSLASGALGGFVSSTAVTVSFSQQAQAMPRFATAAMLAIMAATLITVPRIAIEIAVVNRELLTLMFRPLGVIAIACLIPLVVAWWRSRSEVSDETPQVKNPANLGFAITFGLVYALVTLAIAAAQGRLGDAGLFVVGAVSGITDVDAITLSGARLIGEGRIATAQGIDMILLAFLTNQIAKATIGVIVAPRSMRRDLLGSFGCVIAGTLAAILLF